MHIPHTISAFLVQVLWVRNKLCWLKARALLPSVAMQSLRPKPISLPLPATPFLPGTLTGSFQSQLKCLLIFLPWEFFPEPLKRIWVPVTCGSQLLSGLSPSLPLESILTAALWGGNSLVSETANLHGYNYPPCRAQTTMWAHVDSLEVVTRCDTPAQAP